MKRRKKRCPARHRHGTPTLPRKVVKALRRRRGGQAREVLLAIDKERSMIIGYKDDSLKEGEEEKSAQWWQQLWQKKIKK